jgi:hypothetical protein
MGSDHPAQVQAVEPEQHDRVEQGQVAARDAPEHPDRGHPEHGDLHAMVRGQLQRSGEPQAPRLRQQGQDGGQPDAGAEQQARRAGQVRGHEVGPAGDREVGLDHVLRQDRHERDQRHHEAVGDVHLRRLARPGEHERGSHDRGSVGDQLHGGWEQAAAHPHEHSRHGAGGDAGEPLLPGLAHRLQSTSLACA